MSLNLGEILVLSVADLQDKLTEFGLDANGQKSVLQERLIEHVIVKNNVENKSDNSSELMKMIKDLQDKIEIVMPVVEKQLQSDSEEMLKK